VKVRHQQDTFISRHADSTTLPALNLPDLAVQQMDACVCASVAN
jgi:hypothetical protein